MIYGEPSNSELSLTEQALLQLKDTGGLVFYPTGSRFFGTHRKDSDYDFFTNDGEFVRNWLNQNGFENITMDLPEQYTDPLMVSLYKKGDVHIQLVNDVPLKRKIQSCLREQGFGEWLISKSFSRKIWRLLVDACRSYSEIHC